MTDDTSKSNDFIEKKKNRSEKSEQSEIIAGQSQEGAEYLKRIEETRSNAHTGSAGGWDESIQIETLTPSGDKFVVSRKTGGRESEINSAEKFPKSYTDLKIAAESNEVLQPIKKLREYAEKLPTSDPNKEKLTNLAREQFAEISMPPKYVHVESDEDAGIFKICAIENQIPDENKERLFGASIGIVESIGSLAVSLAQVADFAAAIIVGNEKRAGDMGASFGKTLGESLVGGVNLFSKCYDYLYNLGFEGDIAKPIKDIALLGQILDRKWKELPIKEQERLKFRLITDLAMAGLPFNKTGTIKDAREFSKVLDEVAIVASASKTEVIPLSKALDKLIVELSTPAMQELKEGEIWAGARQGTWKIIDPHKSPDVVIQSLDDSCMSAVGEMLLNGAKTEAQLIQEIGHPSNVKLLAKALGEGWIGEGFRPEDFGAMMDHAPWGAMFLDPTYKYPHMVVIDGFTYRNLILVRDPSKGLKYEMDIKEFVEKTWNGYSVVKTKRN